MILALMNTSALKKPTAEETAWLACGESIEFKADGDNEVAGIIEGYASLFGEVDSGSDVVIRGAFTKSLKERRKSDRWRIPMFLGHAHGSVPVGVWTEIAEDAKGLKVKGRLLFESQEAKQLYAVLKAGGDMGLSIGYRTVQRCYRTPDGKEHADWMSGATRVLKELDLREISITALPMLDSARITGVKDEGGAAEEAPAENAADLQAKALIRALDGAANSFALTTALESAARNFGRCGRSFDG